MKVVIIAALAPDGTIGNNSKIPWHIQEDLQRFKRLTMGHPVLMGRKTYESLGKPLPGRRNLVLTRRTPIPGVECFGSLDAALRVCKDTEVFVIGGAEVYRQALPLADRLMLTYVHQNVTGDTQFPDFDHKRWKEIHREDAVLCSFVTYARYGVD